MIKIRSQKERLLWLFAQVHGEVSGSCYAEAVEDEDEDDQFIAVNVMKNGNLCWSTTREELMLDFMTMTPDELEYHRNS